MSQQAIEQQQAADTELGAMAADCLPAAPISDAELPERPTVEEVARWLRKSRNTIYNWVREGLIPCKRIGRSYIFDKAALLKWARTEEAA
jgi:excisionase family DNA binding protein